MSGTEIIANVIHTDIETSIPDNGSGTKRFGTLVTVDAFDTMDIDFDCACSWDLDAGEFVGIACYHLYQYDHPLTTIHPSNNINQKEIKLTERNLSERHSS